MGPLFLAWVAAASAAQVNVAIGADELREGQAATLTVSVTDASPRGVPELSVPAGLTAEFRTQSQSSMMINFNMTSTVSFQYVLTALKAGTYTIPPVRVRTDRGDLTSAPYTVTVGERSADGLGELVATLGADVAWVGQVLLYQARFTTDQQRLQGQWRAPEASLLTAEPGIEPATPEEQLLQDGKPLTVLRLVYPLRASKPGKTTVPGAVLQAQVPVQRERRRGRDHLGGLFDELGAFTDYTTQVYSAEPMPLEVKPLPDAGRPPGFTGLVGHFTLTATPSASSVNVGDTLTLSVDIQGDAPLAGVTLPPLVLDGVRAYDDQPVTEARLDGTAVAAHATLKRAIVPSAPGPLTLPPVELAYFDPTLGQYQVARSEAVTVTVGGSAGTSEVKSFSTGDTRQSVDTLAEDILPVRTDASLGAPLSGRWAWLPMVPGAAWLLAQAASTWKPRRRVEEKVFDFSDLEADPERRLAGLERIFRERVGARLGVAPEALHREDLARLGDDTAAAEAIYRELERLRYGGARGDLPEAAIRALVGRWS